MPFGWKREKQKAARNETTNRDADCGDRQKDRIADLQQQRLAVKQLDVVGERWSENELRRNGEHVVLCLNEASTIQSTGATNSSDTNHSTA